MDLVGRKQATRQLPAASVGPCPSFTAEHALPFGVSFLRENVNRGETFEADEVRKAISEISRCCTTPVRCSDGFMQAGSQQRLTDCLLCAKHQGGGRGQLGWPRSGLLSLEHKLPAKNHALVFTVLANMSFQ